MTPSSRKVEDTGSRAAAPRSPKEEKKDAVAERFEKIPQESEKVERVAATSLRERSPSAHTLSDRERRTQLRALSHADQQVRTRTHSLLNIDLSQAKQSAEEAVTYRGDTAEVVAFDGTALEFKKAEVIGSGAESTAYDARVKTDGKVFRRAFVEVGNYVENDDLMKRLDELKSLHSAVNIKAPIAVKVYGFSKVASDDNSTFRIGILMDKGLPIFSGEGLPKAERALFCEKLLKGVQEMHRNGITHGDIKVSIELFEDEAKDSSNLMMRINDQDEREPCLIDWGESIDHSELQKLDGSVAFDRVAWKAPSPAFTPYGLVTQLRIAANRLEPINNLSSRDRSRRLDELFNLRKKLDLFNTAVAIVQILNNRESPYSYEKIRTEGATRGEHEPQVEELLINIPSGIPVEMQAFLKKTLQENFETNSLYQK